MTCPDCRQAELVESRENICYTESGLPYVTLCDILLERCPACGNTLVNIPEMVTVRSAHLAKHSAMRHSSGGRPANDPATVHRSVWPGDS